MKNKTLWVVAGGLVLAAACLLAYFCRQQPAPRTVGGVSKAAGGVKLVAGSKAVDGIDEMREAVRSHIRRNAWTRLRRPGKPSADSSMFGRFSDADRKLCEEVQAAMDADDSMTTIRLCSKLMSSSDPEVRSHVVDALGWFGAEALPELTTLMGDSDEDVAQRAINAWESGMSEIDDAQVRFKVAGMALKALANEDALQSIGSHYSIAATELIDSAEGEEAALDMRVMVIQSVVDMIDSANKRLSDLGRGLYEDITGNEWLNVTEAEKYLNDPDNYEPPEESGEILVDDASQTEDASVCEEAKETEANDQSAVVDEHDSDAAAVAEPEDDQVEPD